MSRPTKLGVVVDDIAMGITEVVRGADLLTSTARQLLLYRALGAAAPGFFHCPLVVDEHGRRLAKRNRGARSADAEGTGEKTSGHRSLNRTKEAKENKGGSRKTLQQKVAKDTKFDLSL